MLIFYFLRSNKYKKLAIARRFEIHLKVAIKGYKTLILQNKTYCVTFTSTGVDSQTPCFVQYD